MIQILSALATAFIVITFTILLSKYFSAKLIAATVLCSIAFIYVGFSLKGNTVNSIVLEVMVTIVFYFIAIVGYVRNNALIAYGIVLHGIWDMLHHKALLVKTDIPDYWPLYCLLVDIILGVYFFLVFSKKKNKKFASNKSILEEF
jgi:membrane protease YdiL (CAAX protease family)